MNYFDSNRTNTVILKFEAVKVINLLRNFKNGKIGNYEMDHSQKLWVILLMNIHKPNRVIYDVSK
jgi:hypothetical protein